jgi:hypothetical protein
MNKSYNVLCNVFLSEYKMSQVYIELCDVDPMLDDITIVASCISIWHSHAKGRPNDPWSLDAVFMDPQEIIYTYLFLVILSNCFFKHYMIQICSL